MCQVHGGGHPLHTCGESHHQQVSEDFALLAPSHMLRSSGAYDYKALGIIRGAVHYHGLRTPRKRCVAYSNPNVCMLRWRGCVRLCGCVRCCA